MPPYRCALIGLSNITSAPITPSLTGGRHPLPYSHASALARIPGAQLVAVCDLIPEMTERFVQQWGSVWPDLRLYHDAAELIAEEDLDVLGICTPDDKHADLVVAADERGVGAIMCEKPLATTLADADRMIAAIERHGAVLAVEHTRRWDPFFHRVKELIDARLEPGFDDFVAYQGDGGHDPASEPGASAYVEFANGVRAFYNGIKGKIGQGEWDILGDAGRIRISAATAELWTLDEATGDLVLRPFPAAMVMTGALQAAYEELFQVMEHGGQTRSTAQDGRQVVALIEAILASHQAGGRLVDVVQAAAPVT